MFQVELAQGKADGTCKSPETQTFKNIRHQDWRQVFVELDLNVCCVFTLLFLQMFHNTKGDTSEMFCWFRHVYLLHS